MGPAGVLLRSHTVFECAVVEDDFIATDYRRLDVATGLLGRAICVGIAVVLAPVPIHIKLEALGSVAITCPAKRNKRLPSVIPHQRHGR